MGTTADKLQYLANAIADIGAASVEVGAPMVTTAPLATWAPAIRQISSMAVHSPIEQVVLTSATVKGDVLVLAKNGIIITTIGIALADGAAGETINANVIDMYPATVNYFELKATVEVVDENNQVIYNKGLTSPAITTLNILY